MDIILTVLDTNFNLVCVLDTFESLIWSDRYNECGDFELTIGFENSNANNFKKQYYMTNNNSERIMIIEHLEITDSTEGRFLKISGTSLESILKRRIVWGERSMYGDIQNVIKSLIIESIILPSDGARKIPNFVFQDTSDSSITSIIVDTQFVGDTIYDAVTDLCTLYDIGYSVKLIDGNFVFTLYRGDDHSYNQSSNSYVVFSHEYDNLIESSYLNDDSNLKTFTLIGGETDDNGVRTYVTVGGSETGLNRREIFTDVGGLSSKSAAADNAKYEDLERQLENAKKVLDSAKKTFNDAESDVIKKQNAVEDAKRTVDNYSAEKQTLEREYKEYQDKAIAAYNLYKPYMDKISKLEKKAKPIQKNIDNLEEKVKKEQYKGDKADTEQIKAWNKQISDYRKQLQPITNEISGLQAASKDYYDMWNTNTKKADDLLNGDLGSARDNLQKSTKDLTAANTALEESKKKYSNAKQEYSAADNKVKYIQTEMESVKNRNYIDELKAKGRSTLNNHTLETTFDANIETFSNQYQYRRDYNIGDVVQIKTDYDYARTVRITEMVYSEDSSGPSLYPTFKII